MSAEEGFGERHPANVYKRDPFAMSCPALARYFIDAGKPPADIDTHVSTSFGCALAIAVRLWLETVPTPLLRAMPFQGHLYLVTAAFERMPTPADIVLVCSSEKVPGLIELPSCNTAEFFAGFSYSLMDLAEPGEEEWEVPAWEHPNLLRFWRLERQEMLDLLAEYATYLAGSAYKPVLWQRRSFCPAESAGRWRPKAA